MADLLDFMLMFKRATADYEAKIMEALVEMMKEDVGKEAAEAEEAGETEETEEEEEEAEAEEEEAEDDHNMYVSKPNTVYIEFLLKTTPSRPHIETPFRPSYYESQEQFVLEGCKWVSKKMGYNPEQTTEFITRAMNDHIEQQSKFLYDQRRTGAHVCIENYDKLLAELEYLRMKYRPTRN